MSRKPMNGLLCGVHRCVLLVVTDRSLRRLLEKLNQEANAVPIHLDRSIGVFGVNKTRHIFAPDRWREASVLEDAGDPA